MRTVASKEGGDMALARAVIGGGLGGAGGAVLTLPLFIVAKRIGVLDELPPTRVVDHAAETAAEATEAGGPVAESERATAMIGSHLLYGALAGVGYGLIQDDLDLPAPVAGPAYGIALWATSYAGWLPATGVQRQPWNQDAGEALTPVASHLVYGIALGLIERWYRRRTA